MRRHFPFILILSLVAIALFLILFHSQTHVNSDEAIIGLMGKHILEGLNFPFYMHGQPYNAGAALEAYLLAISFAIFGVGAMQMKSIIVVLSLACMVLFYRMTILLYDHRTAALSTLLFALSPSLLKWHFQVRGYSFYFISIPILTGIYFSLAQSPSPKARKVILFGLACGLSSWNLELILPLVGAFWILLAIRRKLSVKKAILGAAGFVTGYAPAILFNLSHDFSNWKVVFLQKTSNGEWLNPATFVNVFFEEMPKFFGPDTTFWYYPEIPATGYVLYTIALAGTIAAIAPFVKRPAKICDALSGNMALTDEAKDFQLLLLTLVCSVPYLLAPIRVPSYFLGGIFFLSILVGRMVARSLAVASSQRILGMMVLTIGVLAGSVMMIRTARQNQIETVTEDKNGWLYLKRFPAEDIEAVELHLRDHKIASLWTTISFVYPLIFESGERLTVSNSIFNNSMQFSSELMPKREPSPNELQVFVIETDSPLRPSVEALCAQSTGTTPQVRKYGTLTVVEEMPNRR
jgi:4-amino-4-deoxy-L-arabinose transferase-like glycosyltransferase